MLQHLMHIAAGPCLTWQNGAAVMHESFVEIGSAPMGGGLGETLMYETAHPEPVTLPRRYPDAKRIRCIGGLDPAPFNGLAPGLGLAVQDGKMTVDEAVDFMLDVLKNKFGTVTGWRYALRGMIGQIRRKESGASTMLKFLALSALRRTYTYHGGLWPASPARATASRRSPFAARRSQARVIPDA